MNNLKHNMQELCRDVLRETSALLILFSIFIFNPFFNSLFRTDIHLLLKINLYSGLPFSDQPPSCGQLSNSGNSNGTIHGYWWRCNLYSSVQQESSRVSAANFIFTKFSSIEFLLIFSGTRRKSAYWQIFLL